jgi:Zn-dependent M28 family amino/carboxypeptidase
VNLDMIGRGDVNTLVVSGTHHYPHLKDPVVDAARGRSITVVFGHDRHMLQAARVEDWTHAADHGPFHDAGIPFRYFGVEDHADHHEPTDTADTIPVPFYVEAATLVVHTVERLADGEARGCPLP